MTVDIDEVYRRALGDTTRPFAYQRRVAEAGLPEVLDVPTGCGKTPTVLLAWLYRKLLHADADVRDTTPARLIWCLPLRSLSRQTANLAQTWVERLGLDDRVDVHLLMGGEPSTSQQWRLEPHRPAVIVSTLDMALSRALNRGYVSSRYAWPIDFALFNDDCHWVFDEVQLMGVALTTSRQLHGLRDALGVPSRHGSTWMSATVDSSALTTVDAPTITNAVTLGADERADPNLAPRLNASKRLIRTPLDDVTKFEQSVAEVVRREHVNNTLTVVVVNSIKTAQDTAKQLRKSGTDDGATVELLHSRFRQPDRDRALDRVLAGPQDGKGLVVVSTQVIEAGVDLSARTMVTECAPWSSIVQRAGRCNRWGELGDARVVIVESSSKGPYDPDEVATAWEVAGRLHGEIVTPDSLAAVHVDASNAPHLTLRRKDLLDLFDTAPDLAGNDIDVSRFIRSDGDVDVSVCWRPLAPERPADCGPRATRDERCAVPVGAMREWWKKLQSPAWVYDPLERGWRPARLDDVRPGAEFVVDTTAGGYDPTVGFDPTLKTPVTPIEAHVDVPTPDDDREIGGDPLTTEMGAAVSLATHLGDAASAANALCDQLRLQPSTSRASIVLAARLHDAGKAHPVFQEALHARSTTSPPDLLLAKSGTKGTLPIPRDRSGFRHELASVAMLEANPSLASADGADGRLVTYLVGAHHGRIRLGMRSLPAEDEGQVLGVREGDEIGRTDLGDGIITEAIRVDLSLSRLGGDGSTPSWSARATDLLSEHGPFRLAWLEAIVRIADWRASISPSATEQGAPR